MVNKYKGVEVHGKGLRITLNVNGKRVREPLGIEPTKPNKIFAARKRITCQGEIDLGIFDWRKHFPLSKNAVYYGESKAVYITIEQILVEWFDLVKPTLKASTKNNYEAIIHNSLIPVFGYIKVDEFKRRNANEWAKDQTCSRKRISNMISPLRQALEHAVDDELIPANPLTGWSYKKRGSVKAPAINPFTKEEQSAILGALNGPQRNLIQFWFWTGLRQSELVALQWSDIDWLKGEVHINKALTMAADEPEEPKTAACTRYVKLQLPALLALQDQKQYTFMKCDAVFIDGESLWTVAAIRKRLWKPAIKRAGVLYRYPYQCRHTYASMMLLSGDNVMWVAKQMGHASWMQTAKAYARYIQNADRSEGENATLKFWNAPKLPQRNEI